MCGQRGVYSTWILLDGDSDSVADSSPVDRIDYWHHYIDRIGKIIDSTAKGRRLKRIQHPLSGDCDGTLTQPAQGGVPNGGGKKIHAGEHKKGGTCTS